MPILKFLDISTAHLMSGTLAQLDTIKDYGWTAGLNHSVAPYPEGAFVSVPDEPAVKPRFEELDAVLTYARNNGCSAVRFDCDAQIDANLPIFNQE